MQIFLSILAGLVWGGLFGVLNAVITKKFSAGDARQLSAMSMLRTLLDVAALAAVYFTRNLLGLRFEFTLIATAVSLSIFSIFAAFRLSKKMK